MRCENGYPTHKFVPQNFFLNFSREHFQTTALGPKTVFEVVWMYFVAALNAVRKWVRQVRLRHKFVPQNFFLNFSNLHFQITTLGPKTVIEVFWMYFVAALNAVRKRVREVRLRHKFVPQNFFLNFSKEHFQTTTLGTKTVFEVVWMYFVAALYAVRKRVPHAQVRAAKLLFEFFQGTLPNHYFRSQNRVRGGLDVFRCGTKCGAKTGTPGAIKAQVRAAKLFFEFFQGTLPNRYFRSQNRV